MIPMNGYNSHGIIAMFHPITMEIKNYTDSYRVDNPIQDIQTMSIFRRSWKW